MTSELDDRSAGAYAVPDFASDEVDVRAYNDARSSYAHLQRSIAEAAVHGHFSERRGRLEGEIRLARTFSEETDLAALATRQKYARSYPAGIDAQGDHPPSAWENLASFGGAQALYENAHAATKVWNELRLAIREREVELASLADADEEATERSAEDVMRAFESVDGLQAFHSLAKIRPLFRRMESVRHEREDYRSVLASGRVSDEEQRDRAMAEHDLFYAVLPLQGVMFRGVLHFGHLTYFRLCDLTGRKMLLSYDARLDRLRNVVFDLGGVPAADHLRRKADQSMFRVADFFKARWTDAGEADALFRAHAAGLPLDRGLLALAPHDAAEGRLIDRLAVLARTLGRDASSSAATRLEARAPTAPPGHLTVRR